MTSSHPADRSVGRTADTNSAREALCERVLKAGESGQNLCIVGGGSKSFYGRTIDGEPLATRDYHGIVEYEAAELVITARAGTLLSEIEQVLAAERQMLAFEPPHFGAQSTIGGVVAAGLSGPRRPYAGAVRDAVLGVEVLSGTGEILHFGGRVMKNVAGYDVSRLMTGAMGTLGLLLSVSLRVAPQPEAERTICWELDEADAHRRMLALAQRPWPISAMAYGDACLRVRLSGHADPVDEAARDLASDASEDGAYWTGLRDQSLEFFHTAEPMWRLSVPPAASAIDLPGQSLVDWGGALRWFRSSAEPAEIRRRTSAAGGHACLFRGNHDEPFAPLDPVSFGIHERLKKAFDPQGVFNRGRLYAEL